MKKYMDDKVGQGPIMYVRSPEKATGGGKKQATPSTSSEGPEGALREVERAAR